MQVLGSADGITPRSSSTVHISDVEADKMGNEDIAEVSINLDSGDLLAEKASCASSRSAKK